MTEFSIYQINTERDDNRICFLGLDTLERFQHSKEVDPVLYDRVYDGKLDCNSLETISLLTEKLKELRKEVKLCQDIAIRSKVIEEKVGAVRAEEEKSKRKENRNYEQRR